jgi:hypothetical protein
LAASRIRTAPMMSRMALVRCWEPDSQGQGANHRPCTVTLIEGLASMLASVSCQDSHAQQGEQRLRWARLSQGSLLPTPN